MLQSQEDWVRAYEEKDALWIHDNNPKRPHALLSFGQHSNGFFWSGPVTKDVDLLREATHDLLEKYALSKRILASIECVVGPQTGATKIAESLCNEVVVNGNNPKCLWASPAKSVPPAEKAMIFSEEDLLKVRGKRVLLCEDVLTTGGSIDLTARAVAEAGGDPLSCILVLVNRSGLTHDGMGRKIISLIERHMLTWFAADCPLCNKGSKALRPKLDNNWALLNASY